MQRDAQHKQVHIYLVKSEYILKIVQMSVSWFGYCTMEMKDVDIGGGCVKTAWDLRVHFFAPSCEYIIISK